LLPITRTNETLASSVSVIRPDGITRGRDVKVYVSPSPLRADVSVDVRIGDVAISLTLDLGERIALIEALGGRA
jgi:hypothetical protein